MKPFHDPWLRGVLAAAVAFALAGSALAAEPAPKPESEKVDSNAARILTALQKLQPRSGLIVLGDNLATVTVPDHLRYYDAASTQVVVEDIWGNPHGGGTLGMLMPSGVSPADAASWGVILTYEDSGHVKDDDAAGIDYTNLLKEMQAGTRENNVERKKLGYPEVELVGWAAQPRYDAAEKKLYWAKELRFAGGDETTLNYNIRALGRSGVLNLNVVAAMGQLALVEQQAPAILACVEFNAGSRYADFNPSTDRVAEYGIAALIAGGIAAKAGLFKVLWVGILAFKKVIIMGVIGLGAVIARFVKNRQKSPFQESPPAA